MNAQEIREYIEILVGNERASQDRKWGEPNHTDGKWAMILAEEFGEVAKALLEGEPVYQVEAEIVQVAAVAVAWLECIERRLWDRVKTADGPVGIGECSRIPLHIRIETKEEDHGGETVG